VENLKRGKREGKKKLPRKKEFIMGNQGGKSKKSIRTDETYENIQKKEIGWKKLGRPKNTYINWERVR